WVCRGLRLSDQPPPSATRSGGQRRSGLQSLAYVAVAAVFGQACQAGRSMATCPYRFHDVTDERRFLTSIHILQLLGGLEFFPYPAAACAWHDHWRVALLGAPAPGA
ncbi:hypothetical protein THAOC_28897, partial [Thalassiosira oceanica]